MTIVWMTIVVDSRFGDDGRGESIFHPHYSVLSSNPASYFSSNWYFLRTVFPSALSTTTV